MAKARQQYFADETTLQKESREFAITPEIINKLDSIETGAQVNVIETVKVNGTALVPDTNKAVNVEVPDVIDNLFSTSTDDALSAKQGKVLYDYLQNIASRGRYLSNWNCVTGLAVTNPSENPYPYKAGDYYSVSNVAAIGGTNYRPDGVQYVIGQASTTVETELVSVSDFYLYDGTSWLLLANSARQIAVDSSLSTTSTNPVENRVVTNAINGKQDTLVAGTNIQIASDGKTISATDTTYSAGTNISIDANNEISAVDTTYTAGANIQISNQNVISATDTVYTAGTNVQINNNVISATDTTYTAGTGISIDSNNVISNTQTSAEWGNITGTLSDQTDLQSALDAKQNVLTAGDNINITNNVISATGLQEELTAGDNIIIEEICISDMQGPAPAGFHIPLSSEWVTICGILTNAFSMAGNSTTIGTYLKMPAAGYRSYSNGDITGPGTYGYYWSSSFQYNADYGNDMHFGDTYLYSEGYNYRSNGFSVRCIKNTPVVPTSSWTTLYDGSTITIGSGVFWNPTDGLISLSGDGTTWYTIMDKNLGATVVYNSGDTLSSDNCGNFYQWGNNYGFPYSGTITNTSSTQVDVTGYGPGNYYSSSTWITTNPRHNTASNGRNLWGGVSQGQSCNLTISATDTTYTASDFDIKDLADSTGKRTSWDAKVDTSDVLTKTNTTSYTPSGDYNPATKKYVDDNVVQKGSTAPSSPTEGMVWYDTTNDQLKVYDGANWQVTGKEYNAGEGISIGDITINGRQGPAPDGFHVPSITERQGVKTIMDGLNLTSGGDWMSTLFIPFAGSRDYSDASLSYQGSRGLYWSSSPYSAGSNYARYLNLDSSDVSANDYNRRASGYSVRCFKDSYITPTSSWTVIYGALGNAGIFRDQTNGLISITSDGSTGYTIMDKNLGATTLYDYGDALSEANMGYMYQWGNNYGFPSTGTISNTSSTQVDASNYGPNTANGYYNSDTFITGNDDWSSVQNDDLWGDTTGTITQENVISNTGVLSVNGQTGDVAISHPIAELTTSASSYDLSNESTLAAGLYRLTSSGKSLYLGEYDSSGHFEDVYVSGVTTSGNGILVWNSYTNWTYIDGINIVRGSAFLTYNILPQNWDDCNVTAFTLSSSSDTSTAGAILDSNKLPIVIYNNCVYTRISSVVEDVSIVERRKTQVYESPVIINGNIVSYNTLTLFLDHGVRSDTITITPATVSATAGDMNYSDFGWQSKTGATITLDLASTYTPSANFTVNAPSTIKDGQTYILRVDNGATAYTMTLGTNITNPFDTDITLTANGIDQFVFLAIGGELELQPEGGGGGGSGGVTSVNGQTGDVTVQPTLVSGTNIKTINSTSLLGSGDITVQSSLSNITAAEIKTGTATTQRSVTAAALAGGLIRISSQANNILANGGKLWAGTQANYEALSSYDSDTVYLTI